MFARRLATIALCAFALVAVSCGSYGEEPARPATDPPWGLDAIDLPNDPGAVEGVLAALPQGLDGLPRSDVSPTQVSYGDGSTFVRAIDLAEAEAEGFPGTAAGYLDLLAGSGEVEVENEVTSADADFVYLVSTNSVQDAPDAEPRTTYDAAWGTADGGWLFVSSAGSAEEREALAAAFVAAADPG
jgi:hypothetical protein